MPVEDQSAKSRSVKSQSVKSQSAKSRSAKSRPDKSQSVKAPAAKKSRVPRHSARTQSGALNQPEDRQAAEQAPMEQAGPPVSAQTLHFISGLPRSGSTVLAALLRQNPRFHAAMSSALAPLVSANLDIMSTGAEVSLLMDETQRPAILRALIEAFCHTTSDRPVFIDTNRLWCARMPLLADLFPDARVVACVRDLPWVLDSLERQFRKNPYENTRLFGGDGERATVYSRMEALARQNRLVGLSWTALKEAFYGEQSDRLLIVDYELFARAPEQTLKLIYGFLGEPWFDGHDFENVSYDAPDFDRALGMSGLHTVRPRVAFEPRPTILPPDLFKKFENMDFWTDTAGSRASVITAKGADGGGSDGTGGVGKQVTKKTVPVSALGAGGVKLFG
ncbi:sulfotransferase [Eilatimonas milleporae]|uniref:Sulfotransferase n=1 Tax=Eilatimonas milleporae TaxID=911205 RepID=A0A3M0CSP2_9PROT|nr:sulfotransferase [Eilatimonas milleporae]